MNPKYLLTATMILFLLLLIGCTKQETNKIVTNSSTISLTKLLTLNDVTKTFSKNDLELVANKNIDPQQYLLKNIKPTIFTLKNHPNHIFWIYAFQNYQDELLVSGEKEKLRAMFNNYYQSDYFIFNIYEAKNIIIIHTTERPISNALKKVNDVVFYQLNEGKKLVFKGEGQNWEAQIVYQYYQHWYKSESGSLKQNSFYTRHPILRYKGPKIDAFHNFKYKYDGVDGGGSFSTDEIYPLDKDGYLNNPGSSGGNGSIHDPNQPYSISIYWNNCQETIKLLSH